MEYMLFLYICISLRAIGRDSMFAFVCCIFARERERERERERRTHIYICRERERERERECCIQTYAAYAERISKEHDKKKKIDSFCLVVVLVLVDPLNTHRVPYSHCGSGSSYVLSGKQ